MFAQIPPYNKLNDKLTTNRQQIERVEFEPELSHATDVSAASITLDGGRRGLPYVFSTLPVKARRETLLMRRFKTPKRSLPTRR